MISVPYPKTSKGILALLLRITFGLSLLLVGISHYMTFEAFQGMTIDGLPPYLEIPATLWAYVLPALMIIGGGMVAVGRYMPIATWVVGITLGSIPVGMLLKPVLTGVSLGDMMPMVINAFIWLIVFVFVVQFTGCEEYEEADVEEE